MNLSFSGVCVKHDHELLHLLWWWKAVYPANPEPYL